MFILRCILEMSPFCYSCLNSLHPLQFVCPGTWLCDLTLERYEVREKKVSKKVGGLECQYQLQTAAQRYNPIPYSWSTHEGIQSPDILPDFAAPQGTESYARYGQRLRIKKSNTEREKVSIRKKASTDPNPTDEDWRQKRSDRMIGQFTISRDCYWRSMSSKRTWWNRGREKCQNLQRATQRGCRSRNFYKAAFVTVNISYDLLPVKQQRIFASPSC